MIIKACCLSGIIFLSAPLSSQLVLNEIMASNASTLEDQFNDYPDWIEIYNAGVTPVQLSDYWLTDDRNLLKKWNFPPLVLDSNSYTLIFASGKDISSTISVWHTVINTGDTWKYFIPTSNIGNEWKTSTASTASWNAGNSGIGYGDNDDATVLPTGTICYYMQREFNIESVNEVTDALLFMDYDDGFVAYLNGTEIARSSNLGTPGTAVNFSDPTSIDHEAQMYQGIAPEEFLIGDKIGLLREGSNILAIEVHNVGSGSSDLSGIPFLVLGFSGLRNEYIYSNPYIIIKNTYPHTNFKIQSAGEPVFLSDNSGNIVDSISNVILPTDYSYGRTPSNPEVFGYYSNPTPGWMNGNDFALEYFSDSVKFTSSGKDYDTQQSISMLSAIHDDQIYYTLDGSPPDQNSMLYSEPVLLNETSVVKARIYRVGNLPGPVSTKTFFTNGGHVLPVISVSMNPFDLWDYNTGIYELGPNAESNNPNFGANFWQDWERPAYIEIYNTDRNLILSQSAGTKIYGAWSRANAQKSMAFYARRNYGDGSFSYKLFSEKPIEKYEAFVMRNGGNDWCRGMFRDGLSAFLTSNMAVDHQAYEPYVMYLNGEYWGILNMREKINEYFIAGNHHVYPDDVNLLETTGVLITGSAGSYNQLQTFISANNFANTDNYEHVKTLMDVKNFISFWAMNVYIDNKDWPGNNNKFWSLQAPGSLFRWISFDTDFGYGIWDNSAYSFNTLEFSFGEGSSTWANPDWATLFIRKLIANDEFKRLFINEFADRMNTIYLEDNIIPVIDSFRLRINPDAADHFSRWTSSTSNWNAEISKMKTFFRERPGYMRQFIMERFGINGTSEIVVDVAEISSGYVRLNSLELREFPFTGSYFNEVPVDLVAVPAPGYIFSHWEGDLQSTNDSIHYGMSGPATITAVFEAVDYPTKIIINEINYSSGINAYTEDWIELLNRSGVCVDLSGWTIWDKSSGENFEIPDRTLMPATGYLVISRNRPDFKRFYPELKPLLGDLPFGIDSEGDGIALLDAEGKLHDIVDFESTAPWPSEALSTGATLELINPSLDNNLAESWVASLNNIGTPGRKNSQYVVGIEEPKLRKELFAARAYPSPFNEETNISFRLDQREKVIITIFSASGSKIQQLAEREFEEGNHTLSWHPDGNTSSGIYLVNIRTATISRTLKVVYQ